MTFRYYLKNIVWGVLPLFMSLYDWFNNPDSALSFYLLLFCAVSFFLYPFSKVTIENLFLKFTTKEFWHSGFFQETQAKPALEAVFFCICYILAIPVGLLGVVLVTIRNYGN
ncbi:Cki family colicin immunity protein [Citrobacter koseri]|uniref:Cki family colicin immunity protein n=1 Tax=Citrobacter TaxID=544 RepID=UPI0023B0746B|nr:Cki family colicin immunity protein [Citrobacter koseri]